MLFSTVLMATIQKNPGVIVGPVSFVLGYILNFLYGVISFFTTHNTLGWSIIGLTIITRILMIPIAMKQQKSMAAMQRLQPEIKKIQDKYKGKADPELQKKMQAELQKLYAKNKYNPFSGCLPMFIQIPIFITLNFIMQNPYLYVDHIADVYHHLAKDVVSVVGYEKYLEPLITPLIPKSKDVIVVYSLTNDELKAIANSPQRDELMKEYKLTKLTPEQLSKAQGLEAALNKFSAHSWSEFITQAKEKTPDLSAIWVAPDRTPLPIKGDATFNEGKTMEQIIADLEQTITQKRNIELYFGVDLVEKVGHTFPNIIIAILSGITTFFSTWLMTRKNKPTDPMMANQQKIMNITMPIVMIYVTMGLSGGVGIYWITSNIFQICQQFVLNKHYYKDKAVS